MKFSVLLISIILLGVGCANDSEKQLEEARFLLDQSRFDEAVAKVEPIVASEPDNNLATFVLASALIGRGALGGENTYLGLLSSLLRDKNENQSDLATFSRIAPESVSALSDLERAADLLKPLTTAVDPVFTRDVYLQLYMARLFEIAGAVTIMGANSPNEVCNDDPDRDTKDNVPDDYDPGALTGDPTKLQRFRSNLDEINGDREGSGLPDSFALDNRLSQMGTDLSDSIANAGDTETGAGDFFNEAFGKTDIADVICVEPK